MELYFSKPEFHNGINLSIRRGVNWDTLYNKNDVYIVDEKDVHDKEGNIKPLYIVNLNTKVMRFCDLKDNDLLYEHDTECRTYKGLLERFKKIFLDFDEREIVTLVYFEIK